MSDMDDDFMCDEDDDYDLVIALWIIRLKIVVEATVQYLLTVHSFSVHCRAYNTIF